MKNQYYILTAGQEHLVENSEVVENLDTVRWNLLGNKFVCKTKVGIVTPPFMNPKKAMTHEETLVEMAKPEWTEPEN